MLVFLAPWVYAHIAFHFPKTFPVKTIEHGMLLKNPIPLENLGITEGEFKGRWQFLYLSPKRCEKACLQQLNLLNNIHIALGKDQSRVNLRLVPMHQIKSTRIANKSGLKNGIEAGSLWIIDPNGFLIMHYPAKTLESSLAAKGILDDARRLVRYSNAR